MKVRSVEVALLLPYSSAMHLPILVRLILKFFKLRKRVGALLQKNNFLYWFGYILLISFVDRNKKWHHEDFQVLHKEA